MCECIIIKKLKNTLFSSQSIDFTPKLNRPDFVIFSDKFAPVPFTLLPHTPCFHRLWLQHNYRNWDMVLNITQSIYNTNGPKEIGKSGERYCLLSDGRSFLVFSFYKTMKKSQNNDLIDIVKWSSDCFRGGFGSQIIYS